MEASGSGLRGAEREPLGGVVADLQRACPADGLPIPQRQIALLEVPKFPAAALRGLQHGQRRVLGGFDVGDGIHHHGASDAFNHRKISA